MYAAYFGLSERPFSLAPDPRYLYLSEVHREALAHLLYGLGEGGSFVQLTGEVGTGKTTVCRALLEQLPAEVDVAMIFNPRLTSVELLGLVCDELQIPYPAGTTSLRVLVDALSRALLDAHARGRRTVLIIDEAQNLSTRVLEEIRLLTNLETTKEKVARRAATEVLGPRSSRHRWIMGAATAAVVVAAAGTLALVAARGLPSMGAWPLRAETPTPAPAVAATSLERPSPEPALALILGDPSVGA